MTVNIRPMIKQDKPCLMQILETTPEFKPSEVAVAEEVIDSYLRDPFSYSIAVAIDDRNIIGYVCYGHTPLTEYTWDIYWIAVTSEKQGCGVGSALIQFAEDDIKKAGGRLIIIETSSKPEYEKTTRFYAGHNYELICRIANFYTIGDDKKIFQKMIA